MVTTINYAPHIHKLEPSAVVAAHGPSFHGQSTLVFSIPDPWSDFYTLLYASGPAADNRIAASRAFLDLPDVITRTQFYPGEGLVQGKCCACDEAHSGGGRTVHACVRKAQQAAANDAMTAVYVIKTCARTGCGQSFSTPGKLWDHLYTVHLRPAI